MKALHKGEGKFNPSDLFDENEDEDDKLYLAEYSI